MHYPEYPEGSHSGLVRAPAKRLPYVSGVAGSNPAPSAIDIIRSGQPGYWLVKAIRAMEKAESTAEILLNVG